MNELNTRISQELQNNLQQRIPKLNHDIAESLVKDIHNPAMRQAVLDLLCLVKIVAALDINVRMGYLRDVEMQELLVVLYAKWNIGKKAESDADQHE